MKVGMRFLPKITLNYKINDNFNIYAGYSTGYMPGGINYFATAPAIKILENLSHKQVIIVK